MTLATINTHNETLYLPMQHEVFVALISSDGDQRSCYDQLSIPEISTLFVLQRLPKMTHESLTAIEKYLANTILVLNEHVAISGLHAIQQGLEGILNLDAISEGFDLLALRGMTLIKDPKTLPSRLLDSEGLWNSDLHREYCEDNSEWQLNVMSNTGKVFYQTAEQSRRYYEYAKQMDEHLHIQGYAGTGKTRLIAAIVPMLQSKGANVLILVEGWHQLNAIKSQVSSTNATVKTFENLVAELISSDLTNAIARYANAMNTQLRSTSRSGASNKDLVRILGISPCGSFSSVALAEIVNGTVFKFCHSDDIEISNTHIPAKYIWQIDDQILAVVVKHAHSLWSLICKPTKKFAYPVHWFHLIKWLGLNNYKIPLKYSHIVVDECHELSNAFFKFLYNSPQPVLSLGDEYQNLRGKAEQRDSTILQRTLVHSVRSGKELEDIINPVISAHPKEFASRFIGNSCHQTALKYYDKLELPDEPATLVTNDYWELWEWAQRLASHNVSYRLVVKLRSLKQYVSNCIELFKYNKPGNHFSLSKFKSWDDLVEKNKANATFQRINRMLERGYSHKDWESTVALASNETTVKYTLGDIELVRNQEFDCVMLLPELTETLWRKDMLRDVVCSTNYVALTRARHKLYVPLSFRHWLEENPAA